MVDHVGLGYCGRWLGHSGLGHLRWFMGPWSSLATMPLVTFSTTSRSFTDSEDSFFDT